MAPFPARGEVVASRRDAADLALVAGGVSDTLHVLFHGSLRDGTILHSFFETSIDTLLFLGIDDTLHGFFGDMLLFFSDDTLLFLCDDTCAGCVRSSGPYVCFTDDNGDMVFLTPCYHRNDYGPCTV